MMRKDLAGNQGHRSLEGSLAAAMLLLSVSCVSLLHGAPPPAMDWNRDDPLAAAVGEAARAGEPRQATALAKRKNRPWLHIRYGLGYKQMNGLKEGMPELDRAGLGVDYKYIGWEHTGPGLFQGQWREFLQRNPNGRASHSIRFRDLRFDVLFSRRWGAGLLFSPLGSYTIGGGKEIPVGDGLEGIQLSADFRGHGYLLTASFIPFPGRSPDSSVIQLQAGVGVNHFTYAHYNHDGNRGPFHGRFFPCLAARAEYSVLSRHWSINFDVNYKYARGRIPGAIYERDDYSLEKRLRFHWREDFPALSADMGGFGCGISLGFHL